MMWRALQAGDMVDVVAPSAAVGAEMLKKVALYIKTLGLEPRIASNLIKEDGFCSNTPEYRFLSLKQALEAEDSHAVWCVNGGYGAAHLIPMLEDMDVPKQPKMFIGFSDITTLHIFITQRWGWPVIHGPVLRQLAAGTVDETSANLLNALIFGKTNRLEFVLTPLNDPAKGELPAEGMVTGGNLSLIQTSVGTEWEIEPTGKILLLEDEKEATHRIDRMLHHLTQAGVFSQVKAVIFGDFTEAEDSSGGGSLEEVLQRFADSAEMPVFRVSGIGHASRNDPILLGVEATIRQEGEAVTLVMQVAFPETLENE